MTIIREAMHYQVITTTAANIQHKGVTLYNNWQRGKPIGSYVVINLRNIDDEA